MSASMAAQSVQVWGCADLRQQARVRLRRVQTGQVVVVVGLRSVVGLVLGIAALAGMLLFLFMFCTRKLNERGVVESVCNWEESCVEIDSLEEDRFFINICGNTHTW